VLRLLSDPTDNRRVAQAAGRPVILVDVSSSMATRDSGSDQRRIDQLRAVLAEVLCSAPDARIVAFCSIVVELPRPEVVPDVQLPEPGGSTDVAAALDYVGDGVKPNRLVVLSDGQPDDAAAAFAAARRLAPVTIDTFYVGLESDFGAIGFMRSLTFMGGRPGVAVVRSLARPKQLATEIAGLIGGQGR
jgi:hypothetical protein